MNTGEVFGNQAAGDEIIASESSRIRSSSATVRSMLDLLRVEVLVSGGLLVCSLLGRPVQKFKIRNPESQ